MIDPHVDSLQYLLLTSPSVYFNHAPALEWETELFHLQLEDDHLLVKMKEHFASIDKARSAVQSYLRAWEIDVGLQWKSGDFHFEYETANMIDRAPLRPGEIRIQLQTGSLKLTSSGVVLKVGRKEYPKPPEIFRYSEEVEALWYHFEGYQNGREPLTAMAYFCFTYLVYISGTMEIAARKFNISRNILTKLRELVSWRGDVRQARKVDQGSSLKPLTNQEITWIESAVKMIIRRVGEMAAVSQLQQITMNDLPPLSNTR